MTPITTFISVMLIEGIEMIAWLFRTNRGSPVVFLLLRYSDLSTVASLSLLYLLYLYLDLYVLGDDALISCGSFMQTKYICLLIHI